MASRVYLALFHPEAGGAYSVTFPDVPGAISQGASFGEAFANAKDALDSYLESLNADGLELPVARDPAAIMDEANGAIVTAIEADVDVKVVRVNATFDERLLARIDRAAARGGLTRSGFLANAARALLSEESGQATGFAVSSYTHSRSLSGNSTELARLVRDAIRWPGTATSVSTKHGCMTFRREKLYTSFVSANQNLDCFRYYGSVEHVADEKRALQELRPGVCLTREGDEMFILRSATEDEEMRTWGAEAKAPRAAPSEH